MRVDRLLQNEVFVRVLAVALAVLIYVQVVSQAGGGTVQRAIPGVPVELVAVPDTLAVTSVTPRDVTVTVRGDAQVIDGLGAGDLQPTVNLSTGVPGRQRYSLQVSVPRGVQYISVTPNDVTVVAEPVVDRQASVQVATTGTVAPGYALGGATVSPAAVVVHGPESRVNTVAHTAAVVAVGGARAAIRAQVAPVPVDRTGHPVAGVQVVPNTVEVVVPVARVLPAKVVPVVAVVTGRPASGYAIGRASVRPARVIVLAPASVLRHLRGVDTAPISVNGASTPVQANALLVEPPGVLALQPDNVTVTVPVTQGGG